MVTVKNVAPFGSSVKRFGKISVHPNLDPSGLYAERPAGCDPCLYRPQPLHEIFQVNRKRKTDKNPWRYKKELEDWARNLGFRNQKVLESRKYRQSVLGPAWHSVDWIPKHEPACNNVGFGRTARWRPPIRATPGPGNYYRAEPFKAPHGPHSSRPSFDREEPCRFKDTAPKWSLAPNRYTIVDKASIEEKSKKVVSKRGPYDLFTGSRDGTIKNHFNTSLRVSAKTWPLALKGTLDKYDKSHFGTMNKTGRDLPHRGRNVLVDLSMCLRRAEEPGPAHYTVEPLRAAPAQNRRAFNSSYDKGPGYARVLVWPAVGRYSPAAAARPRAHAHLFRSKVARTIGAVLPEPMNSF